MEESSLQPLRLSSRPSQLVRHSPTIHSSPPSLLPTSPAHNSLRTHQSSISLGMVLPASQMAPPLQMAIPQRMQKCQGSCHRNRSPGVSGVMVPSNPHCLHSRGTPAFLVVRLSRIPSRSVQPPLCPATIQQGRSLFSLPETCPHPRWTDHRLFKAFHAPNRLCDRTRTLRHRLLNHPPMDRSVLHLP